MTPGGISSRKTARLDPFSCSCYVPRMSDTAHFYRKMIQRQVTDLRTVKNRTGWGPAAAAKLELSLLQAFYMVGKLLSEELTPDGFRQLQVPLMTYAFKSDPLKMKHWRSWRKHYRMNDPVSEMHNPDFIVHQFVHNSLFDVEQAADKQLASVYVTSGHQKHKAVYQIGISDIIELLEEAAQL